MAIDDLIDPWAGPDYLRHPWLDIAVRELGEREIVGTKHNPRVLEYLSTVGRFESDETAWCSAFANWCMEGAGIAGTGKANARSWLGWGRELYEPVYGCVVVCWRVSPDSAFGHVGFYLCHRGPAIRMIGGNQNNTVCGALYPEKRRLSYRWPVL